MPCIANVEQELPALPKLVTPEQALPRALPKAAAAAAAGEGGERKRRGHSFGKGSWACAQNGKWIRTDSECKASHLSTPITLLISMQALQTEYQMPS